MRELSGKRITQLLIPTALYLGTALAVLGIMGESSLLQNMIEKLCCAAVMAFLYIRDVRAEKLWHRTQLSDLCFCAAALIAGAAAAMALNCFFGLIGLTGLLQSDADSASQAVYSGKLIEEIVLLVIAAPAAEELLFRGLIYRRLRTWAGFAAACIAACLIFALFHGNLLQGIYAFLLSLAITIFYERSETIFAAIAFHAGANIISLAATEADGLTKFIAGHTAAVFILSTAVFAGITFYILRCLGDRHSSLQTKG